MTLFRRRPFKFTPEGEKLREISLPDYAPLIVDVLNNENPGPLHDSVMSIIASYVAALKESASGAGR